MHEAFDLIHHNVKIANYRDIWVGDLPSLFWGIRTIVQLEGWGYGNK